MIKKKFDCVEMKNKGAEAIAEKISGLSPSDELNFWKLRNSELLERKNATESKPGKKNRRYEEQH
jgi:hypothetical protein